MFAYRNYLNFRSTEMGTFAVGIIKSHIPVDFVLVTSCFN